MKTKNESGRSAALIVGIYFVLKAVVNLLLGGNLWGIIIAALEAAVLYTGLIFSNYVIAVIVLVQVVMHLPGNISGLSENFKYLIYLLEGVIDVICCALICLSANAREHFSNSPSEIFGGGDE